MVSAEDLDDDRLRMVELVLLSMGFGPFSVASGLPALHLAGAWSGGLLARRLPGNRLPAVLAAATWIEGPGSLDQVGGG